MIKAPKRLKDLPITPLSRPTVASTGITGFWRTFRPILEQAKCNRCLLCWIFCPEGCIKRGIDDVPEIDYNYCKGCGICANECRLGAIEMEREGL